MKNQILGLVLLIIFPISAFGDGGDIVGGGASLKAIMKAFQIDSRTAMRLKREGNLDRAYENWVNGLSERQRESILENVFDEIIVHQID